MIFQDAENALVTVTLFIKDVDTFKHKVRDHFQLNLLYPNTNTPI